MCTLLSFTLFIFALASCGFNKSGVNGGASGACTNELFTPNEAFARTLHPAVISNSCVACHNSTTRDAGLYFADSTASVAYDNAKTVVDFANIGNSDIVRKVEVFNHNCGSASNCTAVGLAFRTQIAAWWQKGENPQARLCSGGGGNVISTPTPPPLGGAFRTAAIAVPTNANLSPTADTNLTWDLASGSPAIAGAHLRVALRRVVPASAATLGTFQVRDVRLGTSQKKYRLRNLQFVINGRLSFQELTFVALNFVVAPAAYTATAATWPFFRMSTRTQDILYETAADTLALAFDLEETTAAASPDPGAPPPADQTLFNQPNGIGARLNQACGACHNASRPFDLSGSIDNDRLEATGFANKGNPTGSQIYLKATAGTNHSGGNAFPNQADRTLLVNWQQALP